jgi:23S rRNA (cytidine1920-2'-O)/16S rRNA (cytidine1409-2'-O)-methyltransferase
VLVKIRLDQLLHEKGFASDLKKARGMIYAGEVHVDEAISDKPGFLCSSESEIRVKQKCAYVSRGGLKLEKGLSHFNISPAGKICIDIGASSGGFTDCLLQHDARKVYAIDVAYGQLAWKIRQDKRVVVMERFNARNISRADLNEDVDLCVIDASFISITKLLPPLFSLFSGGVSILALIKPQFELPKNKIGEGGVVREPNLHIEAVTKVEQFVEKFGKTCRGSIQSPLLGPKGNKEFLLFITNK